jgi:hypothetical protein
MKEKTKTFCEEKCQFYYSPSFVCNMRNQCPLLERLEDAQKEIKEKSEGYAKVCARLHEQVIDLTMKNKELKQKLQEMLKKARAERMEHALDYPNAPASPLWERNQGKIEILEKLLKEENP